MKKAKIIAVVVVALLILIVMLQNTASVDTKLLFVTVTMPRVVLLTATLVVGFCVGLITAGRMKKTPKQD